MAIVDPGSDAPARAGSSRGAAAGWVAALPVAIGLAAASFGPADRVPRSEQPAAAPPPIVETVALEGAPAPDTAGEGVMVAHFIDMGQANATLLEFPCGAVLIDAGAQEQAKIDNLLSYLDDFFARRTDLERTLSTIFITHNHVDHTRALREVVERFTVENFVENGQRGGLPEGDKDVIWVGANRSTDNRQIQVAQVDAALLDGVAGFTSGEIDPVACSGVDPQIRILWADLAEDPGWPGDEFENKNNHSVVVRVDFGESSFLFTGDLEEPAIEAMVERYHGTDMLDTDVYEVGHHGSYNATTESLLEAVTPEIAVISMGRWNDRRKFTAWAYGHPRHEAVELLQEAVERRRTPRVVHVARKVREYYRTTMRDAIFGTGWDGDIQIRATADGTFRVSGG